MILRARQFEFTFPRPALVMGVINATPDSFSDGGKFLDPEAAVRHALKLASEGADIIDVGGESTRPGAEPVSESEELERVLPVISSLVEAIRLPVSIDTMKPSVAEAALLAGASIINDVAANREDDAMWKLAAKSGAGYVAMHMKGTPRTMQNEPVYKDVVAEVWGFFADRLERMRRAGLKDEHVVLDVGIGFGKTLEHNLQLLAALGSFKSLRRPLLLGISRKSFISKLLAVKLEERLPAVLAGTVLAATAGVQMFRAHDVAATVQALRMTEAIQAREV